MNKKALLETGKFILRLVILIGVPQLIAWLTNAGGDWLIVANAISLLLPIADKFIHTNDNIKLNGVLPF